MKTEIKRVLVLYTGGTLGMVENAKDKTLVAKDTSANIRHHVKALKPFVTIDIKTLFTLDSSYFQPEHWITIGRAIEENLEAYDGFVVIHGTDTMAFTACALSFILQNIPKPVILTGSQRPLSKIRTDALSNIINAIELATFRIPEVCILFDNILFRGNRAKKLSIREYDAFKSPNFSSLVEVGLTFNQRPDLYLKTAGIFKTNYLFDQRIFTFRLFPGFCPQQLYPMLDTDLKAILIEGFGAGGFPIHANTLTPLFKKCQENQILVAICSQSIHGSVEFERYEYGKIAQQNGVISCLDMTVEASIVKLMFLFGLFNGDQIKVKQNFHRSIAGEVTVA